MSLTLRNTKKKAPKEWDPCMRCPTGAGDEDRSEVPRSHGGRSGEPTSAKTGQFSAVQAPIFEFRAYRSHLGVDGSLALLFELFLQQRHHLKEISYNAIVRDLEYRRFGIFVYCHYTFCSTHPHQMLDST